MGKKLFNYVIGNPPYQEETTDIVTTNGQRSRKNVFQHFQIAADSIAASGSVLIYPGVRWMHQSGKGLKQFGYNLINDHHLEEVIFYPDASEVFGNAAELADGITIVLKDASKTTRGFVFTRVEHGIEEETFMDNPGEELIPLNPKDNQILEKVNTFVEKNGLEYLHDAILPRSLFGIESDFVSKNPEAVRPFAVGDKFDAKTEIKLFTNDKAGKAGRTKWFVVNRSTITSGVDKIGEWQVVVSSANAGGQKRDNQIEIIDNFSAYGRSRIALRSFKTFEEAKHFYDYCKTYIVRFMFLMTDEALTSLGKRVPDLLDYSRNNALISFDDDLDKQLFESLGLTSDEQEYVINRVRSVRGKEMS